MWDSLTVYYMWQCLYAGFQKKEKIQCMTCVSLRVDLVTS